MLRSTNCPVITGRHGRATFEMIGVCVADGILRTDPEMIGRQVVASLVGVNIYALSRRLS